MVYHVLIVFHVSLAFAVFALSIGFWRWQVLMHILASILAAFGTTLYFFWPKTPLHFLYGILALLTDLKRELSSEHGLHEVLSQDYGRFYDVGICFDLSMFSVLMFGRGVTPRLWGF